MRLYDKGSVFDLERVLEQGLRRRLSRLEFDPNDLEEVVLQQTRELTIDPPDLDLASELAPVRQSERVVQDDGRYSRLALRQSYKVVDVVYEIPVSGFAELLDWSPQSRVFSYSSAPPERSGNKVILNYSVPLAEGPGSIQQQVASDLDMLKKNVAALRQWVFVWNDSVERRARSAVLHRVAELKQKDSLAQSFRIKL